MSYINKVLLPKSSKRYNFEFMMQSSQQIANFFINKSLNSGRELTPMKLIKLTYIAHGWNLGIYDAPLLDEAIQAWKYGPVIESIYDEFKRYGSSQIVEYVRDEFGQYPAPDTQTHPLLEMVWETYGKFNGVELSAMTHQPNTPWDIVWNQHGGSRQNSALIPNDLIKEHYKQKIAQSAHAATSPN